MPDRLKEKVAIVTGAGRGIGRAEALALASEGARLVVNDLGVTRDGSGSDAGPADEVVSQIKSEGGEAVANYDDVTKPASARNIVNQALSAFGRLDILVNNAGIQSNRPVFDITDAEFDQTLAIHLKGHWNTISPALEVFKSQGSGCIVNTSSMAGLGQLKHVDYCAAKEGIVGLTRALALELLPYGIRVNDVRPKGLTRMSGLERVTDEGKERLQAELARRDPLVVGMFIAYLCSDAAEQVTGQDFFVQGNEISLMSIPRKERTVLHDGGWDLDSMERLFPATIGPAIAPPVAY